MRLKLLIIRTFAVLALLLRANPVLTELLYVDKLKKEYVWVWPLVTKVLARLVFCG